MSRVRTERLRRVPLALALPVALAALVVAVVLGIGLGPIELGPRTVLAVAGHEILGIGEGAPALETTVVMTLRMPRVLFGALSGAALAVSGAALQSLFRNPLADPGIIGVSAGASTGAVGAIVLLPPLATALTAWAVPAAAFAGGLLATGMIYLLARPSAGGGTSRLLLVGIAIPLADLNWPIPVKLLITWAVAVLVLIPSYDLLVRNTWLGRWLNGHRRPRALKRKDPDQTETVGVPADSSRP